MWEEDWENPFPQHEQPRQHQQQNRHFNFDFFSLLSKPKDYYGILELDFDATEDDIRSSYIKLALRWHPDKQKDGDSSSTSRFQEINEAYQVLSNPVTRSEYDLHRMQHVYDRNIIEYLHHHQGLILTCNGLGIRQSIW